MEVGTYKENQSIHTHFVSISFVTPLFIYLYYDLDSIYRRYDVDEKIIPK